MTVKDKYWIAGVLEGEGCFSPQNSKYYSSITVEMTDEDVISRIASILNVNYYKCGKKNVLRGWKQSYKINIRGLSALRIMKEIQPIMGERRSAKIQECLDKFVYKRACKVTYDETVKIFKLKGNKKVKDVANEFGITHWRVYQIWRGEYTTLKTL